MGLLSSVLHRHLRVGLVDPDLGRERGGDGTAAREALWMREERGVEDGASTCECRGGEAVVDLVWRAEAE